MTIHVTFNEFDKIMEALEDRNITLVFPSVSEIDIMKKDPGKYWKMAAFLEQKLKPLTNEEKYSVKNLKSFLKEHLVLIEEEGE